MQASDVGLLNRYMELLTPGEQSYVREGSSEAVQRERLLARTLQRTTLARYLAISQLQLVEHVAVLCTCASQSLLVGEMFVGEAAALTQLSCCHV